MPAKKKQSDNGMVIAEVTSKPQRKRVEPIPTWVKAKVVAAFLGLSEGAIYRGEAGTGESIRSAHIPGTTHKKRSTRRFLWEDVLKLHKQMMSEAERQEEVPAGILRLMGGAWKRR